MDAPSDAKRRRTFSPEFKQQAACLVLDQSYSHMETSRSGGVGETVLRRWVRRLQMERQGVTPQGKAITPDRQRIPELEIWTPLRAREMPSSAYAFATSLLWFPHLISGERESAPHPISLICEKPGAVDTRDRHTRSPRRINPDVTCYSRIPSRSRINSLAEISSSIDSASGSRMLPQFDGEPACNASSPGETASGSRGAMRLRRPGWNPDDVRGGAAGGESGIRQPGLPDATRGSH
ncbi:transposase [Burkholderia cepacia]|nr:transposase [Burkholderia cepacia]